MIWLVLSTAICVEVFATLGLRASEGFRKKAWIAPVVVGYLASFYLLWLTLALGMPVGIAYALTLKMMLGIGLIIAGVLTIELAGAVR
jgi:small multidrug resistance pump